MNMAFKSIQYQAIQMYYSYEGKKKTTDLFLIAFLWQIMQLVVTLELFMASRTFLCLNIFITLFDKNPIGGIQAAWTLTNIPCKILMAFIFSFPFSLQGTPYPAWPNLTKGWLLIRWFIGYLCRQLYWRWWINL